MKIRPRATNAIAIEVENTPEGMKIMHLEIHETGEGITITRSDHKDMFVEKRGGSTDIAIAFEAYSIRLKPINP